MVTRPPPPPRPSEEENRPLGISRWLLAEWCGPKKCQWYPWLLAVLLLYCCCILHCQAVLQDPPSLPSTLLCHSLV